MHSILGMFSRLLEVIVGRPVDELVLGLPYPRPAGHDIPCLRYVRLVEFDRECLSFTLPTRLLDAPCVCANENANRVALLTCQKMESEWNQGAIVERVRSALLERLQSNPELSELAPELGISARALVRRLAGAGVTYSHIKDELRRTHAAWYLEHTELSIEAIASRLGYTDHTNFSRKFKVWYRVAPSKMRRSLRTALDREPTSIAWSGQAINSS